MASIATQENVVAYPRSGPDYPRNRRPLPKKLGQLPKNLPHYPRNRTDTDHDPATLYRMSDPFATLYGTPTARGPSAFAVPLRATPQADEEQVPGP